MRSNAVLLFPGSDQTATTRILREPTIGPPGKGSCRGRRNEREVLKPDPMAMFPRTASFARAPTICNVRPVTSALFSPEETNGRSFAFHTPPSPSSRSRGWSHRRQYWHYRSGDWWRNVLARKNRRKWNCRAQTGVVESRRPPAGEWRKVSGGGVLWMSAVECLRVLTRKDRPARWPMVVGQ